MNASECRNVHILIIYYYCWGDREDDRNERTRKIITHSWNEEAQKKQVGVKNLLNTKSKKSQENLRRNNLSGN